MFYILIITFDIFCLYASTFATHLDQDSLIKEILYLNGTLMVK